MSRVGIRFVLGVWLIAVVLQIKKAIQTQRGWPKPSILVKTTAAFSALGILSEFQPEIAGALAVGMLLALLINDPSLLKNKPSSGSSSAGGTF